MLVNKTWAINFANKHTDKQPKWNKKILCAPGVTLLQQLQTQRGPHHNQQDPHQKTNQHEKLDQDVPLHQELTDQVGA
jgi:hypothetical protein